MALRRALPLALLVVLTFQSSSALNVLFFFPISTYSHRIPVWPLVEGLANKGHNVTFVSPYPPKEPNPKITEFAPREMVKFVVDNEEGPRAVMMRQNGEIDGSWWVLPDWGTTLCEMFLNSPDTQEWLKTSQFDLIVIDGLYNDCGLGLAHYFKARHMAFVTTALFMWNYDAYGVPHEASWIPDMQYHFSEEMTFVERLWTTVNGIMWAVDREYNYLPKLKDILKKGLNSSDLPPLREIEKNVSLVLMNSHFSEEFPRSLPPLVVPVGGLHIKESKKPLPQEFEDFINKGGDRGFVYISFGSAVQMSQAPEEIRGAFFDAVKRLKYLSFIWKWDDGPLPSEIPSNVFMQRWMPQQQILAHPKIKAFLTHGGLMSMQEAVYHGVPLISMPVFAEQDYNAERVHSRGFGTKLEVTTVTSDQLVDAILKVVNDPTYKERMAEVSLRFKDRPMKPAETAMWWTEYVLRHGDTSHLRPKSINQSWYTRRMLDVYCFLLAVALAMVLVVYNIVSRLMHMCRPSQQQPTVQERKKQQ